MMRILADALLVLSALLLPSWAALFFGAVLFFTFERFYELLAVALFMDLLYGAPLPRFWHTEFAFSLTAVVVFVALSYVKRRIRV